MKIRFITIITLCFLLSASWAFGQNVSINNVVITKYQNTIYVYFSLEGSFSPEMEEAITSGIETTYTFYVVLKKHRGGILSDPKISRTHDKTHDKIRCPSSGV